MRRLEGKRAIVTGAAGGIGQAIARRFVDAGASVVLSDIDPAVEEVAVKLGQRFIVADVARQAQVASMIDAAAGILGGLDVLVNNAGVTHQADLLDLTEADFDRVFNINLKSALFATQAAARHMTAHRSGAIINISSINAVLAIPDQIPYVVSKAALKQLTNVTAIALARHGVRVNAIGPGTIETPMTRAALAEPATLAQVRARTPLGRCGTSDEIAAVAEFLASDDASYITGQTLYADGGRLGLNYTMPDMG